MLLLKQEDWALRQGIPLENCAGVTHLCQKEGVSYLLFPPLEKMEWLAHGFSTRLGGVSKGCYGTMNLSFTRGDETASVAENFRRMGRILDTSCERMVYAMQTHSANVKKAEACMGGMGVVRPRNFADIDALVTDVPGLCLVTSHADCVPVFLVDASKKAIGLAHSGWRGTVGDIGGRTVQKMGQFYGSRPRDVLALIGPSICKDCYEVGKDLREAFLGRFAESEIRAMFTPTGNGKYLLNLHLANVLNLKKAGVPPENIFVTDACTCCNPQIFYSHRASGENRGGLCGFLKINEAR